MEPMKMLQYVDHTLLKATAGWADIVTLCEEAIRYQTASVCIPSCYVKRVKDKFEDKLTICTVVGFPLGYASSAAKIAETRQALADGADEIDMVINLTDVKNGDYQKVEDEIRTLKKETGNKVLKVIIEACYLDENEKIAMCRAVTAAGADYIKTSTGFGTGGATLADVQLFKQYIGADVKIKAAGGVRSVADMEAFLAAGVSRIGTSSAVSLVRGQDAAEY